MRLDGTDKLQLALPELAAEHPKWSPDGKQIAFTGWDSANQIGVYVVSFNGGPPKRIVDLGYVPSWSPDGKSLAYSAFDNSVDAFRFENRETRITDLDSRKTYVVPDSRDKRGSIWSPDGKFLLSAVTDLWLFDFRSRKWSKLTNGDFSNWVWSIDGKEVYAVDESSGEPKALRIRLADKRTETLTNLKNFRRVAGGGGYWINVTPDGSLLLARDVGTQEIYSLSVKWP